MKRREALLATLGLTAMPLRFAEAERYRRVGILLPAKLNENLIVPFRERLGALGWVEGRNLAIEVRNVQNRYERAPALTRELVRLKVDVIVAASTALALAAKDTSGGIPVVFAWVADPVGSGLAASLARPGGNLTGLSNLVFEVAPKQLELLKALVPALKRVAALTDSKFKGTRILFNEAATRAAASLGLSLLELDAGTAGEIDEAFALAAREHVEAMLIPPHPLYAEQRQRIAQLALQYRLATAFQFRSFVAAGGLISYGTDLTDGFLRTAAYVDKILRGAKPGDLPIQQSDRFELVVNRGTAKALGLTISKSVLLQATEVIE